MLVSATPPATEVDITVTGLRSAKGQVLVCMTRDARHFPDCRGDAGAYSRVVPAAAGTVHVAFKAVRPGSYAIALLHDENANGKADRALGVVPKEGFGFSRDAPVRMAPPKFDDAVFAVGPAPSEQTIRMRYLF